MLDDDDIIQEMRNGNEKLLNYFKRDKLKLLIDYITKYPEEDDQKKGHKFPFLVNEIFSLDNGKLNEKFFSEEIIEDIDHSANKQDGDDDSEDNGRSHEDDDTEGSREKLSDGDEDEHKTEEVEDIEKEIEKPIDEEKAEPIESNENTETAKEDAAP